MKAYELLTLWHWVWIAAAIVLLLVVGNWMHWEE
jgi:hypothetical protein